MKQLFTILFVTLTLNIQAQLVSFGADFENINIGIDSALNGSDGSGGFQFGHFFFENSYNAAWSSWSGWAISSYTDTVTAGYTNQFSCISGTGYSGNNYAIAYASPYSVININNDTFENVPVSLYINNATYTYLSMRDGDGFAKKFGGATGDDPDYLLLTIKAYADGLLLTDSVDFYLADYRFSDNSMDYIIKDWTMVDLSVFGTTVDSLTFNLSSTDNSSFGMNTPAYFCIDDIMTTTPDVSTSPIKNDVLTLYPNPTTDYIRINGIDGKDFEYFVFDQSGRMVLNGQSSTPQLKVTNLEASTYFMVIQTEDERYAEFFVKQ